MLQRLFIPFGFCLIAIAIFVAELFGIAMLTLWLFQFEGWWVYVLLAVCIVLSFAAFFFILWMASILYWEAVERRGK